VNVKVVVIENERMIEKKVSIMNHHLPNTTNAVNAIDVMIERVIVIVIITHAVVVFVVVIRMQVMMMMVRMTTIIRVVMRILLPLNKIPIVRVIGETDENVNMNVVIITIMIQMTRIVNIMIVIVKRNIVKEVGVVANKNCSNTLNVSLVRLQF